MSVGVFKHLESEAHCPVPPVDPLAILLLIEIKLT